MSLTGRRSGGAKWYLAANGIRIQMASHEKVDRGCVLGEVWDRCDLRCDLKCD